MKYLHVLCFLIASFVGVFGFDEDFENISYAFFDGEESCDWEVPANWEEFRGNPLFTKDDMGLPWGLPALWNKVNLNVPDANAVLSTRQQVSKTVVSSQSRLKLEKDSHLFLTPVELHCLGTDYCSGHGLCVEVDTCDCDPGWQGADCSIPVCDEEPNLCGFCPGSVDDAGRSCDCPEFLGRDPNEVNRLLLLQTNSELVFAIKNVIEDLEDLKVKLQKYDPSTLLLAQEIFSWRNFIVDFHNNNLATFAELQMEFTDTIRNNTVPEGAADPCEPDPMLGV